MTELPVAYRTFPWLKNRQASAPCARIAAWSRPRRSRLSLPRSTPSGAEPHEAARGLFPPPPTDLVRIDPLDGLGLRARCPLAGGSGPGVSLRCHGPERAVNPVTQPAARMRGGSTLTLGRREFKLHDGIEAHRVGEDSSDGEMGCSGCRRARGLRVRCDAGPGEEEEADRIRLLERQCHAGLRRRLPGGEGDQGHSSYAAGSVPIRGLVHVWLHLCRLQD